MSLPLKPSRQTVFVVLLVVAGLLVAVGQRPSAWLRAATGWMFAPFADVGMGLATSFEAHVAGMDAGRMSPTEVSQVLEQNRQLRLVVDRLEGELAERDRREMARDRVYGRLRDFPCRLIAARVVAGDSLPYGSTRLTNAGRSEGVEDGARVTTRRLLTDRSKALPPGLATIHSVALVGRITESGALTARLQLVTDRGFSLRANVRRKFDGSKRREIRIEVGGKPRLVDMTEELARTRLVPVQICGDGKGGIIAENVKAYHTVEKGDLVETRRDDAFLPAAVWIGEVEKVELNAGNALFVTLHIRPHADLDALREVFIVDPKP